MRTKDIIGFNAGVKNKEELLTEDTAKLKEMEAVSKLYSTYASFIRDISWLKNYFEVAPIGLSTPYPPYYNREKPLSPEESIKIKKRLYSIAMKKLDDIKETIEDTLGEKKSKNDDDDEAPEVVISAFAGQ